MATSSSPGPSGTTSSERSRATRSPALSVLWLLVVPWLLVGALALAEASSAQVKSIRFTRVGADGLSQQSVHAVHQDAEGFLWLGTEDGLNRFDGYSFDVFKHDPDRPRSLSHSHVWDLASAPNGDLWIATDGGGVDRFLQDRQSFESYLPAEWLPSGRVRALRQAGGSLWLATRQGLVGQPIDEKPSPDRLLILRHDPDDPASLPGDDVRALAATSDALWVGGIGGLARLDLETGRVERVPITSSRGAETDVRALLADGRVLWIGTSEGLVRHDLDGGAERRWRHDPDDPRSLSHDVVRNLLLDHAGRLWAGTESGFNLIDVAAAGARVSRYGRHAGAREDLANSRIMALYQDRSDMLWIGTQGGLHSWNPRTWSFAHMRHDPDDPASLSSSVVTSFSVGPNGDLWVGTMGGGLNRLDVATGRWSHLQRADGVGLVDDRVMALAHAPDGTLWIGTFRGGLHRLDPGQETMRGYRHDPDDPRSLPADAVAALHVDRRGQLWVGTFGGGLARLTDREAGTFRIDDTASGALGSDMVTSFAEGDDGRLWVGTDRGGLHLYQPASDDFVRLSTDRDDPQSLSHEVILSLHVDDEGTLWVGTRGRGLDRLLAIDEEAGSARFTHLTEDDGLPNGVVYGILSDAQDRLWLSTNNGLAVYDPERRSVEVYDESNGLQQREFNFGAHYRDEAGRLYFGGFNGFNVFHPDAIEINETPPRVVLTDVRILDRPLPLDDPLHRLETLELEHDDDIVTFEVAALDFVAPHKTRFAYQLEGFDSRWIELGAYRRITFTDLDPGDYVLRVRATNSDGVTSAEPLQLRIQARPAPWHTWWAYTLYLLGLSALAFGLVRWRMRDLRANERRLVAEVEQRTTELRDAVAELERSERAAREAQTEAEQANRAKSAFLSKMSHELRTPLNAVLGFANLLRRDATVASKHREHLAIIARSGEHLLGLIDQVLSLSKIEAGKMELDRESFDLRSMLLAVLGVLRVRAERKGLWLESEGLERAAEGGAIPRTVLGDQQKLRQVLLNLLGNAIKFTPRGGRVTLRAAWRDGRASFEIEDQGPGIPEHERERLFQPFEQTSSGRAEVEGTGLGLAISRDFVELMGGTIEVESTVGRGSLFRVVVELPRSDSGEAVEVEQDDADSLAVDEPAYRVLIVDDHEDSRMLLVETLRGAGFELFEAADGAEGVERWRRLKPHAVLMDMSMPGMRGDEAIRAIRAEEEALDRERTVIIASTAAVLDHQLAEGADDFLSKPFDESDLFRLLKEHLGARFVHRDDTSSQSVVFGPDEALSIPPVLRRQLVEWLSIGDVAIAREQLTDHPDVEPTVRSALIRRLRDFEIAEILDLLEQAGDAREPARQPAEDHVEPIDPARKAEP